MSAVPGELPNSIREVGQSKFLKILVYAMWGCGKTVFLGSGGSSTLIIRPPTDHTESLIKHYPSGERPKEWVVHDWDEMESVHQYLRLHGGEWDFVWLDSISAWQDTGLDDIWQATIENKPSRNAKHAGRDKGEFGRNMDRLGEWVRNIVSIDTFNFGITAWPTNRLDAPDGERKLMPWIQGSMMSEKTCGYMQMVGYMEKKRSSSSGRVYRVITFEESDDFYAKDAFGSFTNGRLVDPTIPKLVAAVEAARGVSLGTAVSGAAGGKKKATSTQPTSGKKRKVSA